MLAFFRRHQRIFFFGTTFVIIVSFVFFGTYSAISRSSNRDEKIATTLKGHSLKRSDMEKMSTFIRSDQIDNLFHAGRGGFNFLNDGVIQNDFLESGILTQIIERYPSLVSNDFKTRLARERSFVGYTHPRAKFINAETAWTYFAPDLKKAYDRLRQQVDPLSKPAVQARVDLYLQEKRFPSYALRQVLEYQQSQYNWIEPDPALRYQDLTLFGYNTFEDWFGPETLQLISFVIFNSAEVAQEKGYQVTDEEVRASLVNQANISFKANAANPYFEFADPDDYYREQLRLMNMSEGDAISVWKKVMLFRRYFADITSSTFVDNLVYTRFNSYAKKAAHLSMYQMDPSLSLKDAVALQQFETYIKAVADPGSVKESPLSLPKKFYSVEELEKSHPALVQRRYEVEIAQLDKQSLQARVSIKQMWDWELQEDNWKLLTAQFPELASKSAVHADDRLALLDSLDKKARFRIDSYARMQIVELHPEWIDESLAGMQTKREPLYLRSGGSKQPLKGVKDSTALAKLLDQVAVYDAKSGDPMSGTSAGLQNFTGDSRYYYRIRVLERSPNKEIVTFSDAVHDGLFEEILVKDLDAHYKKIRESDPASYQDQKKQWKPLEEVKEKVAEDYSKGLLDLLAAVAKEADPAVTVPQQGRGRFLAPYRFYKYVETIRQQAEQGQDISSSIYDKSELIHSSKEPNFANQWLLTKTQNDVRRDQDSDVHMRQAYTMPADSWSKVFVAKGGSLTFFKVDAVEQNETASHEQLDEGQKLLGSSGAQIVMEELLNRIDEQKLIGPSFMKRRDAESEE